jgi:uncharacterized protein
MLVFVGEMLNSKLLGISIAAAVLLMAFGAAFVKTLLVYRAQRAVFLSVEGPVDQPDAQYGLTGLRDVAFGDSTAPVHGWMVPSRNGSVVILLHGAGANRAQMLPEAAILVRAGYGVLLFDWPGSGESKGHAAWGQPERQALLAATNWLGTEPSVRRGRVAALGFSMGGAILAQVAAHEPRLKAVILEGTYARSTEQNRVALGRWAPLLQWPVRWGWWWTGMRAHDPQPVEVIAAISPRPVMVITGTNDYTVPSWMSTRLYESAADPKVLWVIAGAGHGRYGEVAADYGDRLVQFLGTALDGSSDHAI